MGSLPWATADPASEGSAGDCQRPRWCQFDSPGLPWPMIGLEAGLQPGLREPGDRQTRETERSERPKDPKDPKDPRAEAGMYAVVRTYEMAEEWDDSLLRHLTGDFVPTIENRGGFVQHPAWQQ